MKVIKNFANYIIGKDIINSHREYKEAFAKKWHNNFFNYFSTGTSLLTRYAPLPFEIDGIRRIVEGQYLLGGLELFASEVVRILDFSMKTEKESVTAYKKNDKVGENVIKSADRLIEVLQKRKHN